MSPFTSPPACPFLMRDDPGRVLSVLNDGTVSMSSSLLSSGYLVGERSCSRRHRGTVDVDVDVDVRRGRWETRAAATYYREASSEDATEGSNDGEDDRRRRRGGEDQGEYDNVVVGDDENIGCKNDDDERRRPGGGEAEGELGNRCGLRSHRCRRLPRRRWRRMRRKRTSTLWRRGRGEEDPSSTRTTPPPTTAVDRRRPEEDNDLVPRQVRRTLPATDCRGQGCTIEDRRVPRREEGDVRDAPSSRRGMRRR